jgi:hypothetical protein
LPHTGIGKSSGDFQYNMKGKKRYRGGNSKIQDSKFKIQGFKIERLSV